MSARFRQEFQKDFVDMFVGGIFSPRSRTGVTSRTSRHSLAVQAPTQAFWL